MKWGSLAFLLVRFASALAQPAEPALVYVWMPAGENSTRISTSPPPWYRAYQPSSGPRVRVYRNKLLVDDTELSTPDRIALLPRPKVTPKSMPNGR